MRRFCLGLLGLAVAVLALGAPSRAAVIGSVFNPNDFTAIQPTLSVGALDTLTIDTDAMTLSINGGPALNGVWARTQHAVYPAELAVFTFGAIDIAPGATINVGGGFWHRGLVLASQGNLDFGAAVDVSGTSAVGSSPGLGGRGADGGSNGSTNSSPPAQWAGNGGAGSQYSLPSFSYGAGAPDRAQSSGGAGASYGGSGGYGRWPGGGSRAPGPIYGDSALTDLYGGSGGGGGDGINTWGGGGGGGGGSLELVAMDILTMTGTLSANGGHGADGNEAGGGGGSGGGILLAADLINFSGSVNASGGDGGTGLVNNYAGGGGGGGRVAFYANSLVGAGTVNVAGGPGGAGSLNPGQNGTVYYGSSFPHVVVPEPASLAIWSLLGAVGMVFARLRRRKAA